VSKVKNNLILSSKVLNKKYVAKYSIGIMISIALCIIFLFLGLYGKFPENVKFFENGNIDYKVYLKENDFFVNKYLGKDRQYIAELINYIIADLEYNISLDNNDISYIYDYKVEIEADVIDKETKNIIFNKRKELICKEDLIAHDGISISENIKIDYSYYNKLVKELINSYGLMDSVKSMLKVHLYVDYDCTMNSIKDRVKNKAVLTMEIPLSERTVNVSLNNDIFSLNNDFFVFNGKGNYTFLLVIAAIFGGISAYLIFRLGKYLVEINNYESNFEKKLNKILKSYESYIQKAEGNFDFRNYKILFVDEFESMLELRDMLSKPIMMLNNEAEGVLRFVITTDDIAYVYQLMK